MWRRAPVVGVPGVRLDGAPLGHRSSLFFVLLDVPPPEKRVLPLPFETYPFKFFLKENKKPCIGVGTLFFPFFRPTDKTHRKGSTQHRPLSAFCTYTRRQGERNSRPKRQVTWAAPTCDDAAPSAKTLLDGWRRVIALQDRHSSVGSVAA